MNGHMNLMTELAADRTETIYDLTLREAPIPCDVPAIATGMADAVRGRLGAALIATGERIRGTSAPRGGNRTLPA